jgi:DNA integrity scanning protein DisA with diadenylate cyclase activity
LRGIQWIYDTLSPAIVVALVVVFQPEIRRILEKTASLHKRQPVAATPELARLIGELAFKLAERSWGALLVIPGRDSVVPWISHGIALDGLPSDQVLFSIFDPHSGGHDGAVLIENERISRFAVRLPLTTTGTISPELGLRHHAAQGLAEVTDALVIAVSEERGAVTAFAQGSIYPARNKDTLTVRIVEHIHKNAAHPVLKRKKRPSRAVILELLGSLLLAVIFWLSTA